MDITVHTNVSVSCWVKLDVLSQEQQFLGCHNNKRFYFGISSTNKPFLGVADQYSEDGSALSVSTGQWNHYALVADGGTATYYFNGSSVHTMSYTQSSATNPDNPFLVGARNDGGTGAVSISNPTNGCIDEVALWNTALSSDDVAKIASKPVDFSKASTYATDRTSNLKLWLRAGDKVLPESDASIARSDFYTDFDGANDEVRIKDYTGMSVGGSDHTITGWIKFNELNSDSGYTGIIYNGQSGSSNGHVGINPTNYLIGGTGNGTTWVTVEATASEGRFTTTGTWHHIAQVRQNNILYLYKDGVMVKSGNHSVTPDALDEEPAIGSGGGGEYFNGAVSNVGIYKTALPANDIALMAKSRFTPMRDNRFSVVDFDGGDEYITISNNSALSFGTNAHTISAWAKIDALANYKTIISKRQAGGTATDYNLSVGANGVVYTYNGSNVAQTAKCLSIIY